MTRITVAIVVSLTLIIAGACGHSPISPTPIPVPVPEPTPAPMSEPNPVPEPEPTPMPEPQPIPVPVPTPIPTPMPVPGPGGVDTSWRTLVDGAGNPGPVEVRFLSVSPAFGSGVKTGQPPPNPPGSRGTTCDIYPDYCLQINVEARMNPVANPSNSAMLNQMQVQVVWSPDGRTLATDQGISWVAAVLNGGSAVSIVTTTSMGTYFSANPNYILVSATWGPAILSRMSLVESSCPSYDVLATWTSSATPCSLRTNPGYKTEYHIK